MGHVHPDAMKPHGRTPRTRTAPPVPMNYGTARMRRYLLFDATGILYLIVGFVILRAAWALGDGPGAWQALMADFANPLYLAFHALTLAAVVFVAVRFFRLFPKAQPPKIGPAKPPPRSVIHGMLYAVWLGVTVVMVAILGGLWP